jgi:hypothetical protein
MLLPMLMMRSTALAHVTCRRLGGDERRSDVHRQGAVDLRRSHLLERADEEDHGVVDQDVQPAARRDGLVDGSGQGLGVRAVGLDGQRPAAGRLDPLHNLAGTLRSLS